MSTNIVILAAGLPHFGTNPAFSLTVSGLSVLDWQLSSLKSIDANIDVVVGYKAFQQKRHKDKQVNFIENPEWENTQSVGSLMKTDLEGVNELWISYGDVLYYSQTIETMLGQHDKTIVVYDSEWRTRYVGRDNDDIDLAEKVVLVDKSIRRLGRDLKEDWVSGEFVGLVCLRGNALIILKSLIRNCAEKLKHLTLPELLELLRIKGVELTGHDVKGQWAELNEPRDLAHFIMGTKAETLSRLRTMVKSCCIQEQVSFSVADWKDDQLKFINAALTQLEGRTLVVRSSARSEDSFTYSNAGAYLSLLNVEKDKESIRIAVEEVVASYDNQQDDDQVLIQPMLSSVLMSGVVFTRTLEHGAPYLVINYEASGSTDGITSGQASENSVFYFHKDAPICEISCQRLKKVVSSVIEIETLLNYDALDIEFALDRNDQVHIFQVRPITLHRTFPENFDQLIADKLSKSAALYESLEEPTGNVVGSKALFGNMPDWNPAEIIGTNPGELAYSLYLYLILNDTWAQQRAEYGYRDIRTQSLMKRFVGKPYIDVRSSFNSFLPKNLSNNLSARLVDFYTNQLIRSPQLHDKIEFEVIPTCIGLNFKHWERQLSNEGGFSEYEISLIKEGLLDITNSAITRIE